MKILDPLVSPYWGLWALKTEELFSHYDYFDAVSELGSRVGLTFSGLSGYDAIRKLRAASAAHARGVVLTALVWEFYWLADVTKTVIEEEVFGRARA